MKVDEGAEPDRVAMLSIQADGTPVPGQVLIEGDRAVCPPG